MLLIYMFVHSSFVRKLLLFAFFVTMNAQRSTIGCCSCVTLMREKLLNEIQASIDYFNECAFIAESFHWLFWQFLQFNDKYHNQWQLTAEPLDDLMKLLLINFKDQAKCNFLSLQLKASSNEVLNSQTNLDFNVLDIK